MGHNNAGHAPERNHGSLELRATIVSRLKMVDYAVRIEDVSAYAADPRVWQVANAEELADMASKQADKQLAEMPVMTMAGTTAMEAVINTESPDVDSAIVLEDDDNNLDPNYYATLSTMQDEPA